MAQMSRETSRGIVPVAVLCALFGISRQGYYAALKAIAAAAKGAASVVVPLTRRIPERFAAVDVVLAAIKAMVAEHQAWGVRKVWAMLRREHELRVGKNRVYALMKAAGLLLPPDRVRTPSPRGTVAVEEPNRRWASDMTTVYTARDGWVGVTPTVDCGCRSVLSVVIAKEQDAATLLGSLRQALVAEFGSPERVPDGLEWRTDHGPQFTGVDARDLCDEWNVDHTFAPIGRPTGNAVAERLNRTLKEEVLWLQDFETIDDVRRAVEAWLPVYNGRRPHQALGFKTPAEVRTEKLAPLPLAA